MTETLLLFLKRNLFAMSTLTVAITNFDYLVHWQATLLGVVASAINIVGISLAWYFYLEKKNLALSFLAIISKYAFLIAIIISMFTDSMGHLSFVLGFLSYFIVLALVVLVEKGIYGLRSL